MSINVFLSNSIPEDKSNILSIISFQDEVNYNNNIINTGLLSLNSQNLHEIWKVNEKVNIEKFNDIQISQSDNYMFGFSVIKKIGSYEEIKVNIAKQYNDFFEVSKQKKMKVLKIWHYLPKLLDDYDNKKTNYSLLCEARESVYKSIYTKCNYPAATVIGIKGENILIYFFSAVCEKYKAIENTRQVSSYNYPMNIFLEKPMFSRAVSFIPNNSMTNKILVSGTASIKGYESMHSKNILRQLDETLENYNTFFDDKKNLSNIARVYMSSTSDNNIQLVSNVLNKKFGENNYALLKGDICRPELLIEIEGMISV